MFKVTDCLKCDDVRVAVYLLQERDWIRRVVRHKASRPYQPDVW